MIRIGILGAGNIAGVMAKTVKGMRYEDAVLAAVGSRSQEKADAFAARFGIQKAYGSYEDLVSDPDLDLIYVAVPHSHHRMAMDLCFDHGKNVLCEKPFTPSYAESEAAFRHAEESGCFVTEAIWPRYMPARAIIDDLIGSGRIGTPYLLTASCCYRISHVERMIRPELAGGALLDLGIYPLTFALMTFGEDARVMGAEPIFWETGVDAAESFTLKWDDGKLASLTADMRVESERLGMIYGDKGFIEVENVLNPDWIKVFDSDHRLVQTIDLPERITGYEYEVLACKRALEAGALECAEMPHSRTMHVMRLMDTIAEKIAEKK